MGFAVSINDIENTVCFFNTFIHFIAQTIQNKYIRCELEKYHGLPGKVASIEKWFSLLFALSSIYITILLICNAFATFNAHSCCVCSRFVFAIGHSLVTPRAHLAHRRMLFMRFYTEKKYRPIIYAQMKIFGTLHNHNPFQLFVCICDVCVSLLFAFKHIYIFDCCVVHSRFHPRSKSLNKYAIQAMEFNGRFYSFHTFNLNVAIELKQWPSIANEREKEKKAGEMESALRKKDRRRAAYCYNMNYVTLHFIFHECFFRALLFFRHSFG